MDRDGNRVAALIPGGSNQPEKIEEARRQRKATTGAERHLWERLRAGRFFGLHFRRQHVLGGFIADFYCHALRLVVEVDGSAHDGRQDYDAERTAILGQYGLRVIRFANDQVFREMEAVLAAIRAEATPTLPKRKGARVIRSS